MEEKRGELFKLVKEQNFTNAYDAEEGVNKMMEGLIKKYPEIEGKLKDGAFKTGADLDSVLFVGGIYLRNLIFPELGFELNDLDSKGNE